MENNKIKVSVIMPVYNSGKYLKTAVDSILSQSLKEIECKRPKTYLVI